MGFGEQSGGLIWVRRMEAEFFSWLNIRIWGFPDGFGGNKAEDEGWVLVWDVRRVGWECFVMEWGVKSLIWGVLSNGVCRDTKGV